MIRTLAQRRDTRNLSPRYSEKNDTFNVGCFTESHLEFFLNVKITFDRCGNNVRDITQVEKVVSHPMQSSALLSAFLENLEKRAGKIMHRGNVDREGP